MKKIILVIMLCLVTNNALASDFYQKCIMFEAIKRGDIPKVQELLDMGFDPDDDVVVQETGLMLASTNGQTEIVKLFLNHGANVNKKIYDTIFRKDNSAVMNATKQVEIMKLFIAAGADLTVQQKDETVISKALAEGNSDVIKLLLNSGIKSSNIYEAAMLGDIKYIAQFDNRPLINKSFGKDGNTPLIGCVKKDNAEMTEFLLKQGASPNIANNSGETPILMAVKSHDLRIVKLLVQYGADLNYRRQKLEFNQIIMESPLILAVNKPEILKVLVEYGVKPIDLLEAVIIGDTDSIMRYIHDGADVNQGEILTPLMAAADSGNVGIMKLLLNNGADVGKANRIGLTPLMVAAGKGNLDAVKELIAVGAKVDNTGRMYKFSALSAAAANGHCEIINELVKAGADVNMNSAGGVDVLTVATSSGKLESVKLLIALGGKPNYEALSRAVSKKHYDAVEYLLNLGMDVNEKDRNGATYLESAVVVGDAEMVKLLLAHGADVNSRDANGVTALGHAGIYAKYFLIDLLQSYGATI